MTIQDIEKLNSTKILSISMRIGTFATAMKFKIMKEGNLIVVITREGLLKYWGNAQYAYMSGVKNKHYRLFKTAKAAINFINK